MTNGWGLLATLTLVAASLAPSLAAAEAGPTVTLVRLCLPQLPSCEAPSAACGLRAPPGGFINVSVRAVREGRPQPATPLVLEPGGERALTDRTGTARFSIPPADGTVEYTIAAEGQAPSVRLTLTWTSATVLVDAAPTVATIGSEAAFRFRVLASTDGSPLAGASVLLADARGDVSSTDPAGSDGSALFPLAYHGPYEEAYRVADVDACGLPLATQVGTLNLTWSSTAATLAPPSLRFPPSDWLRSHVVPYVLTGGEPPVHVEWRLASEAEWREGTIILPDGTHDLVARAVDARNRESRASALLRIDATGPSIFRPYAPPGAPCGDVAFQATDHFSGLDPATFSVTDRGAPLDATADAAGLLQLRLGGGTHALVASARDRAGNPGATALQVRCDATPPRAEPEWNASVWTRCEAVSWRLLEDPTELDESTLRVSSDGSLVSAALKGARVHPRLAEGRQALTLSIQDVAGNLLERTDVVQCDGAPPTLSPTPRGPIVQGYVASPTGLDARAADNASGVTTLRARLDGGPWTTTDAILLEGEGARTIDVEAIDGVGLTANATLVQHVDTVPPRLEVPAAATAGSTLGGRVLDGASGLEALQAIFPDGATKPLQVQEDGTFTLDLPSNLSMRILLTAGDRVGNDVGVVVRIDAPPVTPPTPPAVESGAPRAPTESVVETAQVVYRLQAVAVTPLELKLPEEVRVSGLAEGIRGGKAILVDEAGVEHDLGPVEVTGRNFTASGRPPAPGAYTVKLQFETTGGDVIPHEAGAIRVEGAPAPVTGQRAAASEMPGPGLVTLLAALGLAGLALRRPKP